MTEPRFTGILLYDGDCPFCSAASTAVRHLESVGVVPWAEPAAQAFLEAQFGEPPFALFFADREAGTVRAGRAAATGLCERAGMPVLVRDVVGENYERVADAVRFVSGLGREIDPYHDAYPMGDDAAALFDELASSESRTHVPKNSVSRRTRALTAIRRDGSSLGRTAVRQCRCTRDRPRAHRDVGTATRITPGPVRAGPAAPAAGRGSSPGFER